MFATYRFFSNQLVFSEMRIEGKTPKEIQLFQEDVLFAMFRVEGGQSENIQK